MALIYWSRQRMQHIYKTILDEMVNIDHFHLHNLYLHRAMYISVPKLKKMSDIFATPGDLWAIGG